MTNSMFASIKDSLAKPTQSSSSTSNIMRLKTGNTYTVRLLPYTPEPSKTFFHYYSHGWVSEATGQYQSAISPQTWGDRDPIAEARYRISRTGTEEEKEKYPDPANPGEFYKFRMDMKNIKRFDKLEFMDAAELIGLFDAE